MLKDKNLTLADAKEALEAEESLKVTETTIANTSTQQTPPLVERIHHSTQFHPDRGRDQQLRENRWQPRQRGDARGRQQHHKGRLNRPSWRHQQDHQNTNQSLKTA